MKKNIGIFVNEMFHYRAGIYNLLINSKDHNFFIFTGKTKRTDLPIIQIPEIRFKIGSKTFIFHKNLKNIIKDYKLDIVIIQYTPYMISSRLLSFFSKKRTYKIVAWTHGYFKGVSKNGIKNKLLQRALRRVDGILFFTEDMFDFYSELGFDKSKLFYTDNTLNTEKIINTKNKIGKKEITRIRNKYNIGDRKVLLFVGRIIKSKRLEVLLKTMQYLKTTNSQSPLLLIIGDGPKKNKLKSHYEENLSDNTIWLDKITDETKLAPYFLSADLFIMPGKTGLSINHAFSYGLPYLTTDDDIHAPEVYLLKKDQNGTYFKGRDYKDLAKKINSLLHSPDDLEKFAKNAIQTIQGRYNLQNMYRNFLNLAEKL